MEQRSRRPLAKMSLAGMTFFHRQNPLMVAWWSAAYPGFGQYLLNNYVRATLFTLMEFFINTAAHINQAIAYTFCGQFEMAGKALQPRWAIGYLIVYFYTIWDGYRSCIVQNKLCHLAELEDEPLNCTVIHPMGIQYLERKNPYIASLFSFFFPGLGQLYNQRWVLGFYAMIWWFIFLTLSRLHEAIVLIIAGNIRESTAILNPQWLLFLPSIIGGAAYHSFIVATENNKFFRLEQRQYIKKNYAESDVRIFAQEGI